MKINSSDFSAARTHAGVTTGEVIRILRGKKGWTQDELARRSKISATNLSMLENDRLEIGKRRTIALANAFGVHPAVIMFPEYNSQNISKAA